MRPVSSERMKVEIIGVLFDRCGKQPGSALGPEAVRYAFERHERRDVRLQYRQNVLNWRYVRSEPIFESSIGLRNFNQAIKVYRDVRREVGEVLDAGNVPIVLGGDHSVALGSIPIHHERVRKSGGKLAVLWIDAHADMNSPDSSPTGNLHGMPLAGIVGRDFDHKAPHPNPARMIQREQWGSLLREIVGEPFLPVDQVAWLGLRDVDLPEAKYIARKMPGSLPITMEFIDRHGVLKAFESFRKWFADSGCTHLYVSFDVDSFDPVLAPGTGTAVRGGLTYREGHFLAELLCEYFSDQLVGLDVVEVNPTLDQSHTTVRVAVEWMSSLFGKKILPWGPKIV